MPENQFLPGTPMGRRQWLVTGLASIAMPALAQGTGWPSRPIKMIIPGAPGQGSDLFGRLIGNALSRALGQPVVIDNKPGASGILGTDAAAKAPGDGYTLLFSNASFTVMLQALGQKTPYDLQRDLVPVVQIGSGGVYLVCNPDLPVEDLTQLVALIRRQPEKFQYGTFGNGSSGHLLMEAFKALTGMVIDHVPYKSSVQLAQDIQGGSIAMGWLDVSSSLPLIRAGRLRALAVSGNARMPATPHLRTMREQGFPVGTDGWYGLFAPAGTPAAIVQRLNAEVNRILSTPEWQERLLAMNVANAPIKSADAFAATMGEDLRIWQNIVRAHNIRLD